MSMALDGPWHPVLRAYALAIGVMQDLPESDPRSLAYQASVHGVGAETDPPPDNFRSQCQHNCWYFLPWHRWYLHYFEQIIRSLLTEIDEVPADVAESLGAAVLELRTGRRRRRSSRRSSRRRRSGTGVTTRCSTTPGCPPVNARTAALDPLQTVPGVGVLAQPFSATAATSRPSAARHPAGTTSASRAPSRAASRARRTTTSTASSAGTCGGSRPPASTRCSGCTTAISTDTGRCVATLPTPRAGRTSSFDFRTGPGSTVQVDCGRMRRHRRSARLPL